MEDTYKDRSRVVEVPAAGATPCHDMTGHERAEEQLREYEKVVEGLEEMIAVVDRGYRYLLANRAFLKHRGMKDREQVVGHLASEVLDPDVFERVIKPKLDECFQGSVVRYEMVYRDPEIGERVLSVTYLPIDGPEGIDRVACVLHDITERRQAEEALRQSEHQLVEAQHIARIGSWTWDFQTNSRAWSQELYRIFGLDQEETAPSLDAALSEFVHPEDRASIGSTIQASIDNRQPCSFCYRIIRPDGAERMIHSQGNVVTDDGGNLIRMFGTAHDITDLRQAEDTLREAERKYRDIFENAGEGIFQTTPEGRYIAANPALARMHGFDSPEELISNLKDISREVYVDPSRRPEFKRLIETQGSVRGFEHQIFRRDRSKIWISVNARAVRDQQGEIIYYEGTTQDINERKLAEARSVAFATLARKLSGATTKLEAARIIAETANEMFGWDSCDLDLYDADRDLLHSMLQVDTLEGRRVDVTGLCSDRRPTPGRRRVIDHGPELILREDPIQFDEDAIPFGDTLKPSASIMTVPVRHAAKVVGLLSIQSYTPGAYDADSLNHLQALAEHCGEALNRIHVEESFYESEERFRQIAEHFEDVVSLTDKDLSKVLYINPAYERIFRRTCESVQEDLTSFLAVVHPADRANVERLLDRQREGQHEPFEYRIVWPDGSVRWIYRRSFPIRNTEGNVYLVAAITQDITERKRDQEALRESEERYRDLVENSREFICTHDLDGVILSANRAAVEVLGYDPKAYTGKKSFRDLLVPEVRDQFEDYLDQIRRDGFASGLTLVQTSSGERRLWEYHNTLRTEGVATPIVRGMAHDITERRAAEKALQASEQKYRDIFSFAPVGICQTLRDGTLITANKALATMLGYDSVDELLQLKLDRDIYFVAGERERVITTHENRGYAVDLELQWKRKDGSPIWVQLNAHTIKGDGGATEYYEGCVIEITERKRAEESLRKQNEYLAALHETALGLINRLNLNELLEDIVNRACALVDIPSGYVYLLEPGGTVMSVKVGVGVSRDFVGARIRRGQGVAGRIWQTGHPLVVNDYRNWEHRLPDAGYDVLRTVAAVPLRSGSRVVGVLGVESTEDGEGIGKQQIEILNRFAQLASIALDNAQLHSAVQQELADRTRAEADMSAMRRELELTMHAMNEGIHRVSRAGSIVFENPAAARMLGWEVAELSGKPAHDTMHHTKTDGTPYPREECPIYATFRDGVSRQVYDEVFWRQDGTSFPVEYTTAAVRNDRNEIVDAVVTFRDITERKQAEESLKLFRNLIDQSSDAIEVVDQATLRFLDCNQSAYRSLGYTREEFLSLTVLEIDPLANRWILAQLDEEMKETGFATVESIHRRKDGTTFPVEVTIKLVKLERVYRLAVVRDISSRKRAQEALLESEERYRELFENAKDAIYVHDLSGRYTSVNRAAEKLSGYTREEIMGKHFSNFVAPRNLKEVRINLCRKLDEEHETIYEVSMVTKDRRMVPLEVSSRLIYENGVAIGVQGVARDITDRKRAQEALKTYSRRLIEAQEAERQHIARELHDEIGQVLTAVKINLQSLRGLSPAPAWIPPLDESIGTVDEALGQVRKLSIELRPALLDDLGLSAALRWYVDRYTQRTGIRAEVINGFEDDSRLPRELETACFRIAQEALTNVVRHAQAGHVSVELERSRERVLLTIIDDGVGFDVAELLSSAPAVATLGLVGMEERAQALSGKIEIESALQEGTRIRASFPLKRKQ